jgi:hypothetical protein
MLGGGVTLRKAYSASASIYLAALLVSLGFYSLRVSLGLTAGTALSLGILASWQFIVANAFDPASPKKHVALALGLAKLPIIGFVVWALIGRDLVSAPAFAVGFIIPQIAIALLAVGRKSGKDAVHAAPRA